MVEIQLYCEQAHNLGSDSSENEPNVPSLDGSGRRFRGYRRSRAGYDTISGARKFTPKDD